MGYRGILIIVCLCSLAAISVAQSGGDYEIRKSTSDSGGGTSQGDGRVISGTIGQHDADDQASAGGRFRVRGGFWAQPDPELLFSNSFEEPSS